MTVFIDLIGFSILIPVFPLLISPDSPYRVTPDGWSQHTSLVMLGWLQGIYPFFIFLAAPILGQLSDRVGRRPVLALSIAGTAAGYALFAIGIYQKNLPLLFISRGLDGITGGNLAVAQAAIADVSTNENRAKNFGLIGAAFGLGFILGPYVGGRLSAPNTSFYGLFDTPSWFGATTPFWFATGLAAINCALVLATLPETNTNKQAGRKVELGQAVRNVISGFASPRLRTPLVAGFFWVGGFTFFTTFFGVYLRNRFGFSQSKTGDYFAIVGVFIALTQGLIVGLVAKRAEDYKVLRISFLMHAAMMCVYFTITAQSMLYLCIPLFALFQGLTQANLGSLVSRSAEMGRQGEAMGIFSSVSSLAQVPASVLVGYIAGSISSNTPLVVAAVLIAVAGVIYITLFRPTYLSAMPAAGRAPAH